MLNIPYLPQDIIDIIVSYLDLDSRRLLGVFKKINLEKYKSIESVLRTPSDKYIEHYKIYNLPNLVDIPTRKIQSIDNDEIYICVIVRENVVKYDFGMYRLRKKTNEFNSKQIKNIFWKGNMDDYYWDWIDYQFSKY